MEIETAKGAPDLPGYRRAVRVEPSPGAVLAMLEDDLHGMAVRLRHAHGRVTAVEVLPDRMPWSTCTGAVAMLQATFRDVPLAEVTARRARQENCTHLHDLAIVAAAHALDEAPSEWRIDVSDAHHGERQIEIRRDGRCLHRWLERDGLLADPPEIAGLTALSLRDWIASLEPEAREAARMLQWGALVAHGRAMTDAQRLATLGHRPSCYTMQPSRVAAAEKINGMHEFTGREDRLLDGLGQRFEAAIANRNQ